MVNKRVKPLRETLLDPWAHITRASTYSASHHCLCLSLPVYVAGQGLPEGWSPNELNTVPAFTAAVLWQEAKAGYNVSQHPLQLPCSPVPQAEVVKTTTREAAIGKLVLLLSQHAQP